MNEPKGYNNNIACTRVAAGFSYQERTDEGKEETKHTEKKFGKLKQPHKTRPLTAPSTTITIPQSQIGPPKKKQSVGWLLCTIMALRCCCAY